MPHFDIDTVLGWRGNTVRDAQGDKIGTVGDVFLDRETDRPAWIGVRTGWFGSKESYVSLAQAQEVGDEIHVGYDKELVKSAPQIDADVALTPEQEDALYRHYGVESTSGAQAPAGEAAAAGGGAASAARAVGAGGPADREGGATDEGGEGGGMVRFEEDVTLGHVERRPAERVRIKKVLVTDHVQQTVPVQREVVDVVHEPTPAESEEQSEVPPEQR